MCELTLKEEQCRCHRLVGIGTSKLIVKEE